LLTGGLAGCGHAKGSSVNIMQILVMDSNTAIWVPTVQRIQITISLSKKFSAAMDV